ncbi:30S ribosomal protein S8e [candidate division KSB1 bacterium]
MVVIQGKTKKKPSAKKKMPYRKKRLFEKGSRPALTKLDETRVKVVRTKGGGSKSRLLKHNIANVLDKKTNKWTKTKILTILKSPANRNYVRRNIMTKGTIIETEKGKAMITSRPGQEGSINAVLV